MVVEGEDAAHEERHKFAYGGAQAGVRMARVSIPSPAYRACFWRCLASLGEPKIVQDVFLNLIRARGTPGGTNLNAHVFKTAKFVAGPSPARLMAPREIARRCREKLKMKRINYGLIEVDPERILGGKDQLRRVSTEWMLAAWDTMTKGLFS